MVRYKILESIREGTTYVSGQELSNALGISRTAIWKHVNSLRKEGYCIDASPRKGYLLKKIPDLLLPQELERLMKTKIIGRKVLHYDSLPSTIDVAKQLQSSGLENGSVIIAEKQTDGKGRFGRTWVSSRGGIWLSVFLTPSLDPVDAPKLTVIASLSVIQALEKLGIEAQVKWPNDILVNEKKIAGILSEMNSDLDKINSVIISIGINANNSLDGLPTGATSIRQETGKKTRRIDFTVTLLEELEKNYSKLFDNHFDGLLRQWKSRCVSLDKYISLKTINGEVSGRALDVDQHGRLLLLTLDGQKRLYSSGETTILKKFDS